MTELTYDENETTLIIMNDEGLYLRYKELYHNHREPLNAFIDSLEEDIKCLDIDADKINFTNVAWDLIEQYEEE